MITMAKNVDIHDWQIELARRTAIRFGLRGADLDDAVQETLIHIMGFRYHPEKSSGATLKTAIGQLIRNRLCSFLRDRNRYRRFQGHMQGSARESDLQSNPQEAAQLRIDVQVAMDGLSADEQAVCEGLAEGKAVAEISRQQKCHPSRVRRMIDRIRNHLQNSGLESWLKLPVCDRA